MSVSNPKFTKTGRARTYSDRAPYLKAKFWSDPAHHFWETDSYTQKAKEYFRAVYGKLLSDPRNQLRIENSQEI